MVEAMAHAIGGVLITRGSTYEAACAALKALGDLHYSLLYVGPGDDPTDYSNLFDYEDES